MQKLKKEIFIKFSTENKFKISMKKFTNNHFYHNSQLNQSKTGRFSIISHNCGFNLCVLFSLFRRTKSNWDAKRCEMWKKNGCRRGAVIHTYKCILGVYNSIFFFFPLSTLLYNVLHEFWCGSIMTSEQQSKTDIHIE